MTLISIEQLVPHPDNKIWKKPDGYAETLAEEIRRSGHMVPLAVEPIGDDKYQVVSGNSRLEAAAILGWKDVPADRLLEMSDEESLLMLIGCNLCHNAEMSKFIAPAAYYHKKYPEKDLRTVLKQWGMADDIWVELVTKAVGTIEQSSNKARTTDRMEKAADSGAEALQATVEKSSARMGTTTPPAEKKPKPAEAKKTTEDLEIEVNRLKGNVVREKEVAESEIAFNSRILEIALAVSRGEATNNDILIAFKERGYDVVIPEVTDVSVDNPNDLPF